jgi:hypothetical protein
MQERVKKGIPDIACYANHTTQSLEVVHYKGNQMSQDTLRLQSTLRVMEVLRIFGYVLHGTKASVIYRKEQDVPFTAVKDWMHDQVFREYLFRLSGQLSTEASDNQAQVRGLDFIGLKDLLTDRKTDFYELVFEKLTIWHDWLIRQRMMKEFSSEEGRIKLVAPHLASHIRNALPFILFKPEEEFMENQSDLIRSVWPVDQIKVDNELLKQVSGYAKFSLYFESVIASRIRQYLQAGEHSYIEAFSNVSIGKEGMNDATAEYDVLCVSNAGVLHAFDAKTFDFTQKDNDARLYNLIRASGTLVKFAAVIPYDPVDIENSWVPSRLKYEPFKFNERKTPFYVIADSREQDFYVSKENGIEDKKSYVRTSDHPTGIRCRLLRNAFN